ncbi:MAG: AAA family ATPase [Planctomycetota bacterium]
MAWRPVVKNPVRIYLVGSHSTGKTTLARWIRDRYGLPMISEVARGVLAEMESRLESIRSNLEVVDRYQMQVFERQIAAEREQPASFVSDRAFCNLAYAAQHSTVLAKLCAQASFSEYMASVRSGIVFFLRPHRELLAEDGVRASVAWEEVLRIDGMVKLLLEMHAVPYVPCESLSMQERVRLVESVLTLAGVASVDAQRPQLPFGEIAPRPRLVPNPAPARSSKSAPSA